MAAETQAQRARRHFQRTLFDGAADRYQAARPGYPAGLIDFAVTTAGLGPGSAVLEVGCGTGQLTAVLAGHGLRLSAIDIGPAMIAAAELAIDPAASVSFQVTSFEELDAADASFDLIISSAAFHWVDPEVGLAKSARLLRPGGWFALLDNDDLYDEPLGADLLALWREQAPDADDGAWHVQRPDNDLAAVTDLFEPAVRREEDERLTRTTEQVIALENTRSTSLSWAPGERDQFTAALRARLGSRPEVSLTLRTTLTMARRRPS